MSFDPDAWARELYPDSQPRLWEPLDVPGLEVYSRCARCSPRLAPAARCRENCPLEIVRKREEGKRTENRTTESPQGRLGRLARRVTKWMQ